MTVTCTSHHIEARKKTAPMPYDHHQAARELQARTRTSQGASATHAHPGWLKPGKATIRKRALTAAKNRRARTGRVLWTPEEAGMETSVDVPAVSDAIDPDLLAD